MTESLLRMPQVEQRTGCKKTKIYRMMSEGRFPEPLKLDGCSLWPSAEIDAWVQSCRASLPRGRAVLR